MNRLRVHRCTVCGSASNVAEAAGYDFEYQTTMEEFHYVRCASCGHVYLSDPPAPDALATIYPPHYLPYRFDRDLGVAARVGRSIVQRQKARFYRRILPPDATILEVGAGSGALIDALSDFGSPGWRLTANDFHGDRLQRLAARGVTLAIGNFETLPFEGSFDCIIMNQTIEHLYDPDAALRRCAALLSPRGVLVIETPNYKALDHLLFAGRFWGGYHIPRHFHLYSAESMAAHLRRHGLDGRTEYLLSPSFWIQSLHHYFLDGGSRLRRLFTVNNTPLLAFFSAVDLVLASVWRTSNMRVVVRVTR